MASKFEEARKMMIAYNRKAEFIESLGYGILCGEVGTDNRCGTFESICTVEEFPFVDSPDLVCWEPAK